MLSGMRALLYSKHHRIEKPELLEEVACIGKDTAEEATRIAAVEDQDRAAEAIQEAPEETENISSSASGQDAVVEEKTPLQSMGPFSSFSASSSKLALILAQHGPAAPGSSVSVGADFDEEIKRILAPLSQRVEEVGGSADSSKDLAFLEYMAAGLKEAQHTYDLKWQAVKEQCGSAVIMDKKLVDKGNELREWYKKQSHSIMRQDEVLAKTREDITSREVHLTEREALLNAKEKDISAREGNLEATLHGKDEELEALVQQRTKDLEDKHKAALDALTLESSTQLKKVTNELAAASAAKTDLDQQVAKLTEELAGSNKEIVALKEEAQKAETTLKEAQSQLSSKSQDLDTANETITDMKARLGTLEKDIESAGVRDKLLMKDLSNAQTLQKDAEDKLENQI